jgi:hypothetical protein
VGSYRNTKKERRVKKRMKCKRLIVLLTLALTLVLVPVSLAQAMKPLRFEVSGALASFGWEGTIDSGPLQGYTMLWIINFDTYELKGQVGLFEEVWEIYDLSGTKILAGYDEGVTRYKNGKFTGNGRVTYAIGDWAYLLGCKEHIGGTADFTTLTFTGTVQIN